MIYRVIVTPQAQADLEAIFDYIYKRSPQGAWSVHERLVVAIRSLHKAPLRWPLAREDKTLVAGARRFSDYPYRIIYLVREEEVRVIGVRHGARLAMGELPPESEDD